ncbi:MAG: carboxypeptidase-like regulatory domain-containing protein [Bacteroidetes bacterium]|nr:carboxypeptidase-like regulatory domain-containing protein [Bacteroidota bacterium]
MTFFRMMRYVLLAMCLTAFAARSLAQDNLTGRVYESNTHSAIPGITIRNLKTNFTTVTNQTGAYAIPAKVGDLIVFSAFSYAPDTLYVQNLNYTDIKLTLKQNMLNGVTVTGQQTRLGNLKPAPTLSPFGGETLVYHTDAKGNYNGGVRLNVFDSHSAEKKREKEAQLEKDEATQKKIAEVFSPGNLKNYIPLKGQEMTNFIGMYTPDIATYTSPEFNFTIYINTSYTEFMKMPEEKRKSKDLLNLSKGD